MQPMSILINTIMFQKDLFKMFVGPEYSIVFFIHSRCNFTKKKPNVIKAVCVILVNVNVTIV